MSDEFYKEQDTDRIWWLPSDEVGVWLFSFDKVKVYNMFQDYPDGMTPEEVRIFDEENPRWAEYFADRKR